jgi:protein-tyrosine-phosphatase
MADKVFTVLFLSRRGSARSLMAEAIVNRHGKGRFKAFSASVEPSAAPEPETLEALKQAGYATDDLRPQHWQDFVGEGAAHLDFVFTLSDTAAGEPMPDWPGGPITAHWSYPDPVLAKGDTWEKKHAYGRLLTNLERHLRVFMDFPLATLDRMSLQTHVDTLAKTTGKAAEHHAK